MIDPSIIKNEIDALEAIAIDIEKDMKKLLLESEVKSRSTMPTRSEYYFSKFSGDLWDLQRETIKKYEKWYTMSLIFIQQYIPDKEDDFVSHYSSIGDPQIRELLQFKSTKTYKSDIDRVSAIRAFKLAVLRSFIEKFDDQRHILSAIPGIVKIGSF